MKKLAIVVLLALIGTPAFAADMPIKAPPPPAPVYSWTGWYIGGNIGYSWGDARTDIAGTATTVALPSFFGGFPGNVAFADSNTARLNGVIGGGQVGYNYQLSPKWVLGIEADIQGSGERGSNAFADPFSAASCIGASTPPFQCFAAVPLNGTAATVYDARINWFGTVRGRVGYLITDQVLLYGTGGLAYGRVEVSGVTNVSGSLNTNGFGGLPLAVPFTPGANAFGDSRTNLGFAVGAGIEGKISYGTGWTWKLEYLYVDLGSLDTVGTFPGGSSSVAIAGVLTSPFTGAITTHTHFTDNIVRVGLNYQFH